MMVAGNKLVPLRPTCAGMKFKSHTMLGTLVKISVLASTKMKNAICVAGVDSNDKWVRPVPKDGLNFQPSQLVERGRVVVEPFNEVDFVAVRPLANVPQSEDLEVDAMREPRLIRTLSDSEAGSLLRRLDEHEVVSSHGNRVDSSGSRLEAFLVSKNRSLIVSRVDHVQGVSTSYFAGQGKYRIQFSIGDANFNLPCTDLKWRAIVRTTGDKAAAYLTTARELHFVIGLTRFFKDRYWK